MDFSLFEQALRQYWGEDAALARHEIYFISQRRRGWRQIIHATAGLLRDIWLCGRLPHQAELFSGTVCVVSLQGASGWDALAPLLPTLQATSVFIHPRLRNKIEGTLIAAPDCKAWLMAVQAIFRSGRTPIPGVSAWTVRCCLARRQLWSGAWRRTLTHAEGDVNLLLHNDFDMFSATATETAKGIPSIRSVCVQHGLPTDEFFPTRADIQLVWGEASRKTYLLHNTPPNTIVMGTYRAKPPIQLPKHLPPPQRVLLVSQTHTPVFGRPLNSDFLRLATQLHNSLEKDAFHILLHPEERRLGHPYAAENMSSRCRNPPHEILVSQNALPDRPALVIGFCSTALLEAVQAGHFVLGIKWDAPASKGAVALGAPQHQVCNGQEVLQLFEVLRQNERFRSEWLKQQALWIDSVFAPLSEGWLGKR